MRSSIIIIFSLLLLTQAINLRIDPIASEDIRYDTNDNEDIKAKRLVDGKPVKGPQPAAMENDPRNYMKMDQIDDSEVKQPSSFPGDPRNTMSAADIAAAAAAAAAADNAANNNGSGSFFF